MMTKRYELTIVADPSACTAGYNVRYRKTSDQNWLSTPEQPTSPIVIEGLADDTVYEAEIRRRCCNGQLGDPLTVTFDTSDTEQLPTPTGFTCTPLDEAVSMAWDDGGDDPPIIYKIDRSTASDFVGPPGTVVQVYSGPWVGEFTDTGLTNGTPYFYRIKATSPGYDDSAYAFDDATPAP